MHHHDRAGARRDRGLDGGRVGIEGARIDVDEDRRAARVVDGTGGGEEGEGRRDHLVARLEIEGAERQQQRVGARGAGDGVGGERQCRDFALEFGDFGAQDELLPVDHAADAGENRVLDGLVLSHEVQHRDAHRGYSTGRSHAFSGNPEV